MERKANAGVIFQGHDGSGLEENMAVVAEGETQVMYRNFEKRTRTCLIKELTISSSFILTKPQKHLYVGCAERREKV